MKKTASLLVVLAALFTMSSTFSAEAPKFGADRHVAHGMACASCHGPDGKSPEYPDQETCLKCHQKDALIEKTKAIGPVNPHKAPHNGECTLCHLQHEAPVNYCAECHPPFLLSQSVSKGREPKPPAQAPRASYFSMMDSCTP